MCVCCDMVVSLSSFVAMVMGFFIVMCLSGILLHFVNHLLRS